MLWSRMMSGPAAAKSCSMSPFLRNGGGQRVRLGGDLAAGLVS